MKRKHGDLDARYLFSRMDVDGNSSPVIGDRDGVILMDDDADLITVTRHRFVDGVVDDLVDKMMEPASGG